MPLRPLRMLAASLPESTLRNLVGGAKSKVLKVPDFLRACGLGMAPRSSNDELSGTKARTDGEYGLWFPKGLSGRSPFWRSRKETGGAKSAALNIAESSRSLDGVGKEARAWGGGIGRREA